MDQHLKRVVDDATESLSSVETEEANRLICTILTWFRQTLEMQVTDGQKADTYAGCFVVCVSCGASEMDFHPWSFIWRHRMSAVEAWKEDMKTPHFKAAISATQMLPFQSLDQLRAMAQALSHVSAMYEAAATRSVRPWMAEIKEPLSGSPQWMFDLKWIVTKMVDMKEVELSMVEWVIMEIGCYDHMTREWILQHGHEYSAHPWAIEFMCAALVAQHYSGDSDPTFRQVLGWLPSIILAQKHKWFTVIRIVLTSTSQTKVTSQPEVASQTEAVYPPLD